MPEAKLGGYIGKIRDGDRIVVDSETGELTVQVDPTELEAREPVTFADPPPTEYGFGRELFAVFRHNAAPAEEGAGPVLHG